MKLTPKEIERLMEWRCDVPSNNWQDHWRWLSPLGRLRLLVEIELRLPLNWRTETNRVEAFNRLTNQMKAHRPTRKLARQVALVCKLAGVTGSP